MSDEEFERAIRNAIRRRLPTEAPSRLRTRTAQIPQTLASSQRRRWVRPVGQVTQLVVVLVALLGAGALIWQLNGPSSPSGLTRAGASGNVPSTPVGSGAVVTESQSPTAPSSPTAGAPAIRVEAMAFFDAMHGVIAGDSGAGSAALWSTTDGGVSWSRAALVAPAIAAVAVAAPSYAWASAPCDPGAASTCRSALFKSADGGNTWSQASRQTLSALSFVDANRGWGVDPSTVSGLLRSTDDGGVTWSRSGMDPCPATWTLRTVSFISASVGWVGCTGIAEAGSSAKAILHTTDGGRTWTTIARVDPFASSGLRNIGGIPGDDYLTGLAMKSTTDGFAWENRGAMIRTTNGGQTWRAVAFDDPALASVFAGSILAQQSYLAVIWDNDGTREDQRLIATRDGGLTWTMVASLQLPPS